MSKFLFEKSDTDSENYYRIYSITIPIKMVNSSIYRLVADI